MSARVAYDSTAYIEDAIHEVAKTLRETVLIVMIVIFLFLGSLRSALVPVVAIPVSLIGAVFLMQAFGFTLNLLTLLAIVLSVGLVVDDAIVVVENVERHLREGRTPFEAALVGARELVGPIIAMTITLAAVYAPIGIQGGLTGALFREFAFTLAGAVFISGVVALTLSPMMSSQLLRAEHKRPVGSPATSTQAFDAVKNGYTRALAATLRFRPAVYAVWITLSLLIIPHVHVLAQGAGAQRGSGRRVRRDRRPRQRHARAGDHVLRAGRPDLQEHARVRAQLPDHVSRPAASAARC